MNQKIWVIGFPRCGTTSVCQALEILGHRTIHNPRSWDQVEGYDAAADVFITAHWRELLRMYPKSKFILNTRNVHEWIVSLRRIPGFWESELPFDIYHRLKVYGTHDPTDINHLETRWAKHQVDVRSTIPKKQLLVFPFPFKWKPLCRFLGVREIPTAPFPWLNEKSAKDVQIRR